LQGWKGQGRRVGRVVKERVVAGRLARYGGERGGWEVAGRKTSHEGK
jgi:hypothetical protein